MNIEIKRMKTEQATLGVMLINGRPAFTTLENTWYKNQPNISCIPAGAYACRRSTSRQHGKVLTIDDVLNRTHILIHAGNTIDDTSGCILLGTNYGWIKGKLAVTNSIKAMDRFRAMLDAVSKQEKITLLIGQG